VNSTFLTELLFVSLSGVATGVLVIEDRGSAKLFYLRLFGSKY
jgi:hypothetical protein